MTDDALAIRSGLPADLRFLFEAYPRPDWHGHPNFGPLTQFYLDRHAMFREVQEVCARELHGLIDGDRDPRSFGRNFGRVAGFFLQQLSAHHQIEDHHYFPALARLEPRLGRGFELLDADHHAIHDALETYAADANALLERLDKPDMRPAADAMARRVEALGALLHRHLEDEEELVIPILLDRGEGALDLY